MRSPSFTGLTVPQACHVVKGRLANHVDSPGACEVLVLLEAALAQSKTDDARARKSFGAARNVATQHRLRCFDGVALGDACAGCGQHHVRAMKARRRAPFLARLEGRLIIDTWVCRRSASRTLRTLHFR